MALIRSIKNKISERSINSDEYNPSNHYNVINRNNLPSSLFDNSYVRLDKNPEVVAAVNTIADLVSTMSLRLMSNEENGNQRVHYELSRVIDIEPNDYMTRKSFKYAIVYNLLMKGNQVTFPEYNKQGELKLHPIAHEDIAFYEKRVGFGYTIEINKKRMEPTQLLHFVLNPTSDSPYVGQGYRLSLSDLIKTLDSASKMKRTFMSGKYTPPLIVSVKSNADKLSKKEGRKEMLEGFIETTEAGEPWIIPTDMMSVERVTPITLKDVAINETIQLDKRTVAAILGIPAFLLGVGTWNEKEYNNFIETKIKSIAEIIQQELTKKLIDDPKQFIKFNIRSLKSFDQDSLGALGINLRAAGIMNANEVRDWLDQDPFDGGNERVILENYVPTDRLGDQKKLKDSDNQEVVDEKGGD